MAMEGLTKLFGSKLVKGDETVDLATAMEGKEAIGIYFSAHWCGPCRGFTPKLAEAYKKITGNGKKFEIVFASSDRDEGAFKEYFAEMPWLALPYSERDLKAQLSSKFKVNGIPTLVIVDGEGNTITTKGRDAISSDSEGENFPWKPPAWSDLMKDDLTFVNKDGDKVTMADLKSKTIGLYFSAHWCPPCRGFTPTFADTYKAVKAAGKDFEVIFVSSDRDQSAFDEYLGEMPWYALPYSERGLKDKLSSMFDVEGIPSLVILQGDGTIINAKGRGAISGDKEGNNFPWPPAAVSDISDPEDINDMPTLVVLMESCDDATTTSLHDTVTEIAKAHQAEAKGKGEDPTFAFITAKSQHNIAGRVRELSKLGESGAEPSVVLMNIPKGQYVAWTGGDVTKDSLSKFLSDFADGKTTGVSLG